MEKKPNTTKSIKIAVKVGGAAAGLIIIYSIILIYICWPIDKLNIANAGVFGDSFGIITSLFSALAFAGVIYANCIQHEGFKLQKEENAFQKIEIESNQKEIYKQGFENTFFQLLKLLEQKVKDASFFYDNLPYTGRLAFKHKQMQVRDSYFIAKDAREKMIHYAITVRGAKEFPAGHFDTDEQILRNSFLRNDDITNNAVETYLKVLTNILTFIKKSKIEDNALYLNLLKSQISKIETVFIFYYVIINHNKELTKLITQYNILEYFDTHDAFEPDHAAIFEKICKDSAISD